MTPPLPSLFLCHDPHRQFSNPSPFLPPCLQVWCALTFVTQVKNRPCAVRVLHSTGSVAKCVELTRACDVAALAPLRLGKAATAAAMAAEQRLAQVDL